jgi:nascent polypeptide-associated complex subunit alpha
LKKLLRRYGVEVEELKDVERVEIYIGKKKLVMSSPQVVVFKVGSQQIFQVVASEISEEELVESKPVEVVEFSEDDVNFIIEHTGVSREKAIEALKKAKGDLAKAIMILRGEQS